MKHTFIDQYSHKESLLHKIDPRIKVISFLVFILFVISTPKDSFLKFGLYGVLIIGLILFSKISPWSIFKRSLVVIPFTLMIFLFIPFFKEGVVMGTFFLGPLRLEVTYEGLQILGNSLAKAYLSVLCMILLISSTKFSHLLKAVERLGLPKVMLLILSFMYRYIFVIYEEFLKMWQVKEARSVGGSRLFQIKALANMVGTLFIRTYERAENVYLAMCARGFDGNIRTIDNFQLRRGDVFFLLIMILSLMSVRLV
ncbi:TPA: cobalt ECF transporter T component CbiQ [bacterium]|nr:cobalt ECF transporter T component CbiQ [bacterium]